MTMKNHELADRVMYVLGFIALIVVWLTL